MKKLFLAVLAFFILTGTCFGTNGTTTAVSNLVRGIDGKDSYYIDITATADVTSALFLPILFNNTTNAGAYKSILGKTLKAVRTINTVLTAPTASYDIYILDTASPASEHVIGSPTLATGSTADRVATAAINYIINGVQYYKAAEAAGTEPGDDAIITAKYGAVAFDIPASGTIVATEATGQAAAQFTTAALAIAAIPACAADHVRLGYVTVVKSDGTFTFGTTALSDANTTEVYYSTVPVFDLAGAKLVDRSVTAAAQTYFTDPDGAVEYPFISGPIMVVIANNSVVSAVVNLRLIFD